MIIWCIAANERYKINNNNFLSAGTCNHPSVLSEERRCEKYACINRNQSMAIGQTQNISSDREMVQQNVQTLLPLSQTHSSLLYGIFGTQSYRHQVNTEACTQIECATHDWVKQPVERRILSRGRRMCAISLKAKKL